MKFLFAFLLLGVSVALRSIPDELQKLIVYIKPHLQTAAKEKLPATYGNCQIDDAPLPCQEAGDVYVQSSMFYKAEAHWLSGINGVQLDDITLNVVEQDSSILRLRIETTFPSLPLNLRLQLCLFGFCFQVSQGTGACCGEEKRVWMELKTECHSTAPYLRNPVVSTVGADPIEIRPKLLGLFRVKLADVTKESTDAVRQTTQMYLTPEMLKEINFNLEKILGRYELTCNSLQ